MEISPIDKSTEQLEYGIFFDESLRKQVNPKAPIIDHFLYERDVICISAESGVGKSILALQILCNLTTGTPFLDTYGVSKEHKVLYLQTEGDRSETLERLDNMTSGLKINDSNWAHMNLDGICLNTSGGLSKFMSLARATGKDFDVIIIDPLYTTVKGSLSNDDVATDWVRNIRSIRSFYKNCSFIVINHEGKEFFQQGKKVEKRQDSLFGSTFWIAFMNYNYKLTSKNSIYRLSSGKVRNSKVLDTVELKLIEPVPLMYVYADSDSNLSTVHIRKLLAESNKPLQAKELIKYTQLSKATVYRIIKKLIDNEEIEHINEGNLSLYTIRS